MESAQKKHKEETFICLAGSPELIQYRRSNFENGLPTVMSKNFEPRLSSNVVVDYAVFNFEKSNDNHFLSLDRNVFSEFVLPYVSTLDLFSLLTLCKQMYARVHPFLLKRAVSRLGTRATTIGLSCLAFYENAIVEVIRNREIMHHSTKHMDAAFLAHAKLNKSRIRRALLLKYEELNAIQSDSRTKEPVWATLLVLTAIKKHGSIENIMLLKDYKKDQKQAQVLENAFIMSKRSERIQTVVTEFKRNGFNLTTTEEMLTKFYIFYEKGSNVCSNFSKKLDKFLKMETHHDNPFYLVNSIIPPGRFCSKIFNLIEHVENEEVLHYIFDNANLFHQDEQLFGFLIGGSGENWERLIKSVLKFSTHPILYTTFCCLWDKKELILKDIVEGTTAPEHFFGVRKGYNSFITTMNTFELHGNFHIAHAFV